MRAGAASLRFLSGTQHGASTVAPTCLCDRCFVNAGNHASTSERDAMIGDWSM
jgi:hypothetical protein